MKNNILSRNNFTYLDNNSTTRISENVRNAMLPYLEKQFGNPSNDTSIGRTAKDAITLARQKIADFIDADDDEIIFTSGGSESNGLAINSCVTNDVFNKKHVLTTPLEHDSVRYHLIYLGNNNYHISEIPVKSDGNLNLSYINSYDVDQLSFCSIMYVNNEIGIINPIELICKEIRKLCDDVAIHTDAVQALGKIRFSVKELGVDYLSISGHKVHAPKGVGALFVKKGKNIQPLIWGHQEKMKRGGTENVASIVGFGQAVEDLAKTIDENKIRITKLRDKIETELKKAIIGVGVNGESGNRVSNTTNLFFPGIDSIKLLFRLEQRGIFASTGSACNGSHPQESHVLAAINSQFPQSSIRVSLGEETIEYDVDYFIAHCINIISELRGGK